MSDKTPVHPDDERRDEGDVTPEFSSPSDVPTADPTEHAVPLETDEEERIDALDASSLNTDEVAPELVEPPQPERVVLVDAPAVEPVEERAAPVDYAAVDNVEVIAAPAVVPEPVIIPQPSQTVYVEAPNPPKKRGNRGVGSLIAVLSALIFGVVFAVVVALILAARNGEFTFDFVSRPTFWVPVLFFAVGFVLLVLIVNRASWWVHVIGSVFVGLFVYFGTVATLLFINGIFGETPEEAGRLIAAALVDPFVIAAALVAREVSLWMGLAISARGRRLKARNAEARADYEMQVADRRAEYERARA